MQWFNHHCKLNDRSTFDFLKEIISNFILFFISGPTSSEWYWRIIDAIPKLSVTVNPNWLWKKKLTYKPKKVVVTYYSTYYLSETHYRNYYQNYIHTLVSNTAQPVFRIYQLYSILSVHCFIICIVWIFDSPRSTHLWYIFSYTCPKFYVYIQSCFVTQNSLITSSSQNKQKDVWLLTFIYFKVNYEFGMTKNRLGLNSCFT